MPLILIPHYGFICTWRAPNVFRYLSERDDTRANSFRRL